MFKVLLTVKPIFPNPLWRRILLKLSKKQRDQHTRDVEAIALPQEQDAAGVPTELQQEHADEFKTDKEDSQGQQSFNVSASGGVNPPQAASSRSSKHGCPMDI